MNTKIIDTHGRVISYLMAGKLPDHEETQIAWNRLQQQCFTTEGVA